MPLTKVEKIQIIGLHTNEEEVIKRLQELGLVQLAKPTIPAESRHSAESRPSADSRLSGRGRGSEDVESVPSADKFMTQISSTEELNQKITGLEQTIKYLDSLEEKKGLFSGIVAEKIIMNEKDFTGMINLDQNKIQEEVWSIQEEFNKLATREEHLKKELETILPWMNLSVTLSEIKSTENIELIPGVLPLKLFPKFWDNIEKEFDGRVSFEIVSQDEERVCLLLAFFRKDMEKFKPGDYNFTRVELPSIQKTVLERLEEIERNLKEIYKQKSETQKRAQALKAEKIKLMTFHDYLLNIKKRVEARGQFFYFPHAFILEGWIRKHDLKKLTEDLKERFEEIEILTVKPQEGEEPPISLENKKTIQPFEMLTRLYGMPNSKDLDPTPLLMPFFVLYFGLCITDAGYGVVIMLLSYLLIRRAKGKVSNFIYILFWGGLLTIFGGAITGSWFGDAIDKFPALSFLSGLKKFMLFDPVKNPLIFFALSLALGFVQICYGLILKMYKLVRCGLSLDAIFDPFSTLMIMLGLPLFYLSFKSLLPSFFLPVCIVMLIFGVVGIFFYAFKNSQGGFLIRLFMGFYSIYSAVTGCFLGDILSFSRLLALGLATSGIAMAVNVIAQFVINIPFVGIVIAVLILIVGHTFNIVLQAFGGFVHSMRLQYVEFFTKFYEGGGREFKPFGKEYKYITLM